MAIDLFRRICCQLNKSNEEMVSFEITLRWAKERAVERDPVLLLLSFWLSIPGKEINLQCPM